MDIPGNIVSEHAECQLDSAHRAANLGRRLRAAIAGFVTSAAALAVIDQGVVSGTSFLTTVVIGRFGSQEELGAYYLALSIAFFVFTSLNRTVIAPYTIYCGRRTGRDADVYAGSILTHYLVLTALGSVGVLSAAVLTAMRTGPGTLETALWALLGALPLLLLRQFARDFDYAHLQLRRATALDVFVAVIQLGGLACLARFQMLSIETAFAVMATACAIASLGWFATKDQAFVVSWKRLSGDWRHNWTFARWTFASHVIGSAGVYIMPWIVVFLDGEATTGILAASSSLAGLANLFVCGIDNVVTPKAARAYIDDGASGLGRVLRWAAALYIVTIGSILAIFLAVDEEIIALTYGPSYSGIGAIIAIFILSVLVRGLGMVAANGLWALEHPKANFFADVCIMVTTLGLAAVLVNSLGVLGAAIATLVGAAVGTGVKFMSLRRSLASLTDKELA
jgi:O-antigen/teichoic acid export membrane protein